MAEKIKPYWEKAKELLGKVPKKIWAAFVAAMLVLVAVIVYVTASNSQYTVLFSDLNSSDLSTIITYLEDSGIKNYRLENGDTVLVPKSQAAALQMRLVMNGYGTSGSAYDYYSENAGMLSTESERETIKLFTLEKKLRENIITLDGVKDATVQLTPGSDNTYVLDSNNKVEASASVIVEMHDGKMLTDAQADAIRALVSTYVSGLTVDSVVLTDTLGNLYSAGTDAEVSSDASALKLQLEEKYNNLIRTNVMQVLLPLFGADNVKVGVSCTVDVNRTTTADTSVNLPDWAVNGEGIIGTKVYDNSLTRNGEESTAGGNVGTNSNSELSSYVENELETNGSETQVNTSGQIDYDNPRTETYTERTAGYLTDCMISVSVNATQVGTIDTGSLLLHIARAAGIANEDAEDKISIYAAPFYVAPVDAATDTENALPIPEWAIYAALGGLLLFILLLIIIVAVSKKRRKKKKQQARMQPRQQDLDQMLNTVEPEEPAGADIMHIVSEKSMELRKDIRKFADESPEIAAQVIKSMMKGGDSNG